MTEPAHFLINPSGKIEVMFGAQLVGIIEEWPSELQRRRSNLGDVRAYYWLVIGDDQTRHPASSTTIARRLILHRLSEWCFAAGAYFEGAARGLAAQAERERVAA
jgi:hypothetical protein